MGARLVWPAFSRRISRSACCAQSTSSGPSASVCNDLLRRKSGKVVSTKKKISELPSSHNLPDGTAAPPLPPWTGGLASKNLDASFSPGNMTANPGTVWRRDLPNELAVVSVSGSPPPITDQMTVTSLPPKDHPLDQVAPETGHHVALKKRTRKKKTPDHKNGTYSSHRFLVFVRLVCAPAAESLETRAPRNQLATEILQNLKSFPHCILLTRVGQFYEVCPSFGDPKVNITHCSSNSVLFRASG